jgi:hypothetical protein
MRSVSTEHPHRSQKTHDAKAKNGVAEGQPGRRVQLGNVPIGPSDEVVGVERLLLGIDVLGGVQGRDRHDHLSGDEVVATASTIALSIGKEAAELMAWRAEEIVLNVGHSLATVTALDGALNPFGC